MAKHRKRTSKKVPAKGRLRSMADGLWSLAVRNDWGNSCAVCGRSKCEAHHLIPRQNEATRYDLMNGIPLCSTHHRFDPQISPHQNAFGWMLWLAEHRPYLEEWYCNTVENGEHLQFHGTKSADYYIAQILRLQEYVEPDDFERIVGVRFCEYLRGVNFD